MRDITELRQRIHQRLQWSLSRGAMFGRDPEIFIREFLSMLAFIDERDDELVKHNADLQESGTFNASGVHGGFVEPTGKWADEQEIGSVYAMIAFSMGYLDTHRLLSHADMSAMMSWVRESAATGEFTTTEIVERFGEPSWPPDAKPGKYGQRTYMYLSESNDRSGMQHAPGVNFVCFDFFNKARYEPSGGKAIGIYGDIPRLRNIRIPAAKFKDQFVFTTFGLQVVDDCRNKVHRRKTNSPPDEND